MRDIYKLESRSEPDESYYLMIDPGHYDIKKLNHVMDSDFVVRQRWNIMADGTIILTNLNNGPIISHVIYTDDEMRDYEWAVLNAVQI